MDQVTKKAALRNTVKNWRQQALSVALVPTMGNLHTGHLQLVKQLKELADKVVVSIFVNPTQFVEGEDFETYPRTIEEDLEKLKTIKPDLIFIPDVDEIYPSGANLETKVVVPELDGIFCGAFRPGHFAGVATVVSKLLNMVQPDIAIFGNKDYQQLLVIKKLVADLCIPVEIIGAETVRETSGLALSSRNRYLTQEEKEIAAEIYQTLTKISDAIKSGDDNLHQIEADAVDYLEDKGFKTEYLSIRDAENLGEPTDKDLVVLIATWLGKARLIDNIKIKR
ncbi:MAG: pantoate--beta-alanine ligase [Gammaproteobacteria bacterium]|jgi:pantoate--beta-alanine ligase